MACASARHSAPNRSGLQCCIGRSLRMTECDGGDDRLSDGHRELVEGCADPVAGGDVGGEFIVAAAEVLDERVPSGDGPRGSPMHPQAGRQNANQAARTARSVQSSRGRG
jgi:hypothetical protein